MGDIKRFKKKYTTPMHPWNGVRIGLECDIKRKYGVGNKQEIWKMESKLTNFKDQAKVLLTRTDSQAEKEREQMRSRMLALGLIKMTSGMDDILSLQLRDIMNRRLQTIVFKRRMARSIKHARQLIIHEHITINGTKITSPSYLVLMNEEATVGFAADSAFMQPEHPEAFNEEIMQRKQQKQRAKDKRSGRTDEIVLFDVNALQDPESAGKESNISDSSVADLIVEKE
jgi:small subunit ribosomal protein S4